MSNLSTANLLDIWERCLNQPLLQRALMLLTAAYPGLSSQQIAELSIGQRDMHLLHLREQLFGSRLMSSAVCPQCSERIEWENSISDMLGSDSQQQTENSHFELKWRQYQLQFRLPNSIDLAHVNAKRSVADALITVLQHCISKATHKNKPVGIEKLPKSVIKALNQRIEQLDPHAEISMQLNCPNCAHQWPLLFDITHFLWSELNDWALRMLQTVHALAMTYGWTQNEILALSPMRRQLYLGMVR